MDISDLSAMLGEAGDAGSAEEPSGIWVLAPGDPGGLAQRYAPLLGEARRLADALGCYVHAIVAEGADTAAIFALGADRAHLARDPVLYAAGCQPEIILTPAEDSAAAGWLAERLGAGLIDGAAGQLQFDSGTRALRAARPVYGGDYIHELEITTPVKVVALAAGSLPPAAVEAGREGKTVFAQQQQADSVALELGRAPAHRGQRPLGEARLIIAVGRALGDVSEFELARTLAASLDAELACDRSVRGLGWMDEEREIGVAVQQVAPDLYVALGIRGDTIHNLAIGGARRVIAVHPDARAPIFAAADIAVVAEPASILPVLAAALSAGPAA